MKNCKGLSGLKACKCCCSENLLAAKQSTGVTWGTLTCGGCLCRCKFLVVSYCVCSYRLFLSLFLRKAIMSCKLLNISLKLLLMFIMCQCLFIISFMFGSTLYVTENGIESLCLGLQCFKSNDLSRWSTLPICFLTYNYIYMVITKNLPYPFCVILG